MSFDFSWYIENRVAHIKFQHTITAEHIQAGNAHFMAAYQLHELPVHEILRVDPQTTMPMNALQVTRLAPYLTHPQMGWLVAYGELSKTVRFMGVFLSNMTPVRIKIVATFDDALHFLQENDSTLPR